MNVAGLARLGILPDAEGEEGMVARDAWRRVVFFVLPEAPAWFHAAIAELLADPRTSSDTLLIAADALEAGRRQATIDDQPSLAEALRNLADVPRQLAPLRAGVRP